MRKVNLDVDKNGRRKPNNSDDYFLVEAFLLITIPIIFF